MKTLQLKDIPMTSPDGTETSLNYWEQLQATIRMPTDPRAGMDVEEIRKSIRIIDVLDNVGQDAKTVKFEDADYDLLVAKVLATKYHFADPAIIEFVDDVVRSK